MKPALVISARDNVATALETLETGRKLTLGDHAIVVRERIQSGHKVALVAIAEGEAVIKYGSEIGRATSAIGAGTHVHTHNVSSGRGRGDLNTQAAARDEAARLAEPPDTSERGTRREGKGTVQPVTGHGRRHD